MLELARELAERRARAGGRRRAAPLRQGGAAGRVQPAARPLRSLPARARGRAARSCSSRPTTTIQAGCLGNLNARLTFHGVSGALGAALDGRERHRQGDRRASRRIAARSTPRPVEIGGLPSTEVVSITQLEGGIASNVIPDRPSRRTSTSAMPRTAPVERRRVPPLRSLPTGATYEHAGDSPPAPCRHRLAARPAPARGRRPRLEPKQAWTNVADFTSRGIDAVNFGPGATRYAHRRDEQVEIDAARAGVTRRCCALRLRVPSEPCLSPPSSSGQTTYPFVRLNEPRGRAAARRDSR